MTDDRDDKLREVLELSCRLVDDQLDDAGRARLNELMFGDPAACEVYLNLATLHAHLIREVGGTAAVPPGLPPGLDAAAPATTAVARTNPLLTRQRSWWLRPARLAAAAAVLLVVGAASMLAVMKLVRPPAAVGQTDLAVATVTESDGAQWAPGTPAPAKGGRVVPGVLNLAAGTVVVRFDNGAVATLSGPAELAIESRKSADLKSGSVLVRCDADAVGFTLRTAASDYIDLGTEFGVTVNADASSEVHVFEGVVVARPRASGLVVPVMRNEAGRVEPARGDLVAIDPSAARFTGVSTALPATRPATAPAPSGYGAIPRNSRVVFIGDNATDFETHLLLINQAFARVYPDGERPKLFNAGVTMPLGFKDGDVQQHLLIYKPTHAVLEFGPEIAANKWRLTKPQFDAQVRKLAAALQAAGVEPIIATGFKLGDRQATYQRYVDDYNQVLRKLAAEKGYRLADVAEHFKALEKYKLPLVAPQGEVPTFSGAREMAVVLLNAMGVGGTRVDYTLTVGLLPGTVTRWSYRVKPATELLDAMTAAMLVPDNNWTDLYLPQPEDKFCQRVSDPTHSAQNRDRARGFATNLFHGEGKLVEAVALVNSRDARRAWVNVGANVRTVYVNGVKAYDSRGQWTGWHAGKERVPVKLVAGENQVVVEAGPSFFLSITDEQDWPLE
ncbi:MAG TPA: hypothetical protein VF796_08170 [Humisphaera sp.]